MTKAPKELFVAMAQEYNLLHTLLDNVREYVFVKDTKGRYLLSNRANLDILRAATLEEIVGKTDYDIFPSELAAQYRADDEAVIEMGEPLINREESILGPDGKLRWHLTTKVPLRNDEGEIVGLLGLSRDITRRKQTLTSLQESQARLEAIISTATDAIITTDAAEHIILFNAAAERIFGYMSEEVVGQPLDMLLPQRFQQVHTQHLRYFDRIGETARSMSTLGELWGRRANGMEFPIEVMISKATVSGQSFYTAILRDITQRKQVEDELRTKSQLLTSLLENLPVTAIRIDENGILTAINGAVLRVTGLQEADAIGQSVSDLLPEVAAPIRAALAGGNTRFSITLPNPKGEPVYFDSWVFFDAANAKGAVGFAVDVSERKRAEQEIRQLNAELDRRVTERTAELTVLYEVTSLASQSLELQPTLEQVLERILAGVGRTVGAIHLLDSDEHTLHLAAQRGITPEMIDEMDSMPMSATPWGWVAEFGQPIVTPDLAIHTPHLAQVSGLHRYIGVPMCARGQPIGVLSIFDVARQPFNVEQIALLSSIGDQVGIAVEHMRFFTETKHRVQELSMLARAERRLHRSLHLDQVLHTLVDVAAEITGADSSILWTWDERHAQLAVAATHNLDRDRMAAPCLWADQVANAHELTVVTDTLSDTHVTADDPLCAAGVRVCLDGPISVGDQLFGVFVVGYSSPRSFTHADQQFFLDLARRAVLAVANAHLYAQAQRVAAFGGTPTVGPGPTRFSNPIALRPNPTHRNRTTTRRNRRRRTLGTSLHAHL